MRPEREEVALWGLCAAATLAAAAAAAVATFAAMTLVETGLMYLTTIGIGGKGGGVLPFVVLWILPLNAFAGAGAGFRIFREGVEVSSRKVAAWRMRKWRPRAEWEG